jgi:hypothetical protein
MVRDASFRVGKRRLGRRQHETFSRNGRAAKVTPSLPARNVLCSTAMPPSARTSAVAIMLFGCAGTPTLPRPALAPQPQDAFHQVPYPAPAALVEVVPEPPSPDAVWIDGSWVWRVRHYVWERGGWVIPPKNAFYAPWDARYLADGTLTYAPALWRDARGNAVHPPRIVVPANPPPTSGIPEGATPP